MTPEEKILLERVTVLTEENNQILRGLRRANRLNGAFKIIYWILIIAISYGAYVYIQPYVDQLMKAYASVTDTANKISDVGNKIPDVEKLINSLQR